jgi:hypothetical protein
MSKRELRFFPIALRPRDAAEALGISESVLEKLVKSGKLRKPVPVPGCRLSLYDYEGLRLDFQAWREASGENSWDEL